MPEKIYPLKKVNMSDRIIEIVKDKMLSGEWGPGTRIPSETDLAQMFGVSRLTCRNAIQRLAALGVLEVRVGDGTYVKEFSIETFMQEASDFIFTNDVLDDLGDFRFFFETDCMVLACARRTEDEIVQLEVIHQDMVDAAEHGDLEAFVKTDLRFHEAICQMTHNKYFQMVYRLNRSHIDVHYQQSNEDYARLNHLSHDPAAEDYYLRRLAEEHADYIRALKKRDPSLIMDLLGDYLEQYKNVRRTPQ